MKQTTLEKTALIHAHGIHCGASYLGLSLQYGTSAPDIHLFEKMYNYILYVNLAQIKYIIRVQFLIILNKLIRYIVSTYMMYSML